MAQSSASPPSAAPRATEPGPFEASPLLRRFDALSRDQLETLQLRKLERLIARVHARSPYYRRLMAEAKLTPEDVTSLDVFRARFPFSTKQDFLRDQEASPPYGDRLTISPHEVALINMTGGTSGQGQEIYGRSQRDVHLLGYLHALPWFLAGLRPGDIAVNCVPAGGMTTGGWGPGEGLRIAGAAALHLGGNLSTETKIEMMLRMQTCSFIYASTNYMHTLTEAIMRGGTEPRELFPHMRTLFIAAEAYPPEWAQKIEALWGCRLKEGYGSTQCAGFGASTCESSVVDARGELSLMRMFEWETLFEVLDPATHEPVRSGEIGELVVTNLSVEGSPVMRFRTGDAVRFVSHTDTPGDRCWHAIQCGTIARYDDMMKIRGNNVWPSAVDLAVFASPEVAEYAGRLFTISGKTEVEVRIAFTVQGKALEPNSRAALLAAIRDRIRQRTNVLMTLVEVDESELPKFDYKARRWKDERTAGYKL